MTTRERILQAGCQIWQRDADGVTCRAIARAVGITHAAVLYHFGSMSALRSALAAHAVRTGRARLIAQLIATDHPAVRHMPASERADYLMRIA